MYLERWFVFFCWTPLMSAGILCVRRDDKNVIGILAKCVNFLPKFKKYQSIGAFHVNYYYFILMRLLTGGLCKFA